MNDERTFYSASGLNVETYDARTDPDYAVVEGDVDFYTRCAKQFGIPVLELGSGTGRVAWALAQAGYRTVGLDLSPAMLHCAEDKRATLPADASELVTFVQGKMTDFQLSQTFRVALIPYRGFQSLTTPEEQRRCLRCTHRHLEPGGHLVVDLFDPQLDRCVPGSSSPGQTDSVRHPATGKTVTIRITRRDVDPLTQLITETWRFAELDDAGSVLREEEEVLTLRWTYRHEMRYLFELTGFTVEAEYSDFHDSPPAYGKEQVWVVRKN